VNLLGNAVKYTASGGVAVRAKLLTGTHPTVRRTPDEPELLAAAPDRNASWIVLQVADTGIGIPARDHERIFDEFEQVKHRHSGARPRADLRRIRAGERGAADRFERAWHWPRSRHIASPRARARRRHHPGE
jgi:signal transduction histidine kinase